MSERDSDDALDALYRRASEAEAARPDAAVRARILAEAAAAARRNTPAANQSRYWMGAVAGVAVLGFTLLMLRQMDVRLPGEAGTTVSVPAMRDGVSGNDADGGAERVGEAELKSAEPSPVTQAESAGAAVEQGSAAPVAPRIDQDVARTRNPQREESRDADDAAAHESQAFQAQARVQERAPAPPPAANAADDEQGQLDEVTVTGSRIRRDAGAAPGPRSAQVAPPRRDAAAESAPVAVPAPPPTALRLLQDHFPAQYQSTRAHRVWLVRDLRNGEALRVGEFNGRANWDSERMWIEPSLGNRRVESTRIETVRNLRNQLIEITLIEVR